MSRIRTIKPAFFKHEALFDSEKDYRLPLRLCYAGLWCQADREGRFKWQVRTLKSEVMPHDQGIDFSRVLHALTARGFLVHYAIDGEEFGAILSWKRNQFINNKESASAIPSYLEPDAYIFEHQEDANASITREEREIDAIDTEIRGGKAEGELFLGKGNGLKGTVEKRCDALELVGTPAEQPKRRKPPGVAVAKPEPPTRQVWTAYSEAYRQRYGVEPTRNARVNGQLAMFVSYVGAEDAPHIAASYVRSRNSHYAQRGHSVGVMVTDAEKLRTEWLNGRQMTATTARHEDRTASNGFALLAEEMRAQLAAQGNPDETR